MEVGWLREDRDIWARQHDQVCFKNTGKFTDHVWARARRCLCITSIGRCILVFDEARRVALMKVTWTPYMSSLQSLKALSGMNFICINYRLAVYPCVATD
jgi:hypothetical protein